MPIVVTILAVVFVLGGVLVIRRCRRDHPTLSRHVWHHTRYWIVIAGVILAVSGAVTLRTQTWHALPIGVVLALIALAIYNARVSKLARAQTDRARNRPPERWWDDDADPFSPEL